MLLQHITYFRAVAECGNMTKAAAQIHVSQPSLSIAISKLEEELGVRLFDRIGNRMYLNKVGSRFLQRTNDIMRELEDVQTEISEMAGFYSRQITILSTYDHLCAPFMTEYVRLHPELRIRQTMCLPDKAVELLEKGAADFALTEQDISSEQITWKPLSSRRRAVLLSGDNPLIDRPLIDPAELESEPFIIYCNTVDGADSISWIKDHLGFSPNVRFITNEFEAMVDMVSHNLGVSILTEIEAKRLCGNQPKNLVYSVLKSEKLVQTVGIALRKDTFLSKLATELMRYIEKNMEKS